MLDLLLANRGNVTERLGADGLRLVIIRGGHTFATLSPRGREILPRSTGVARFAYGGRIRGAVLARIDMRPVVRGRRRSFHLRL